jgi:hypothetical protein
MRRHHMPTTEIRDDLLEHLRKLSEIIDIPHSSRGDLKYKNYYAALLDLGDGKPGSPRPQGVRKQRDRQCYQNSWHASRQYGWAYCEGYALSGDLGIPVMHAWNLDLETGRVIDLTWRHPENAYYWGMIIPNETAMQLMVYHGIYGVLASDYLLDVPLLRYGELIPPDGLPPKMYGPKRRRSRV